MGTLLNALVLFHFLIKTDKIVFVCDLFAFSNSILVYVESGAACYYLLQVCKSPFSAWFEGNLKWPSPICLAWVSFLLDQVSPLISFCVMLF